MAFESGGQVQSIERVEAVRRPDDRSPVADNRGHRKDVNVGERKESVKLIQERRVFVPQRTDPALKAGQITDREGVARRPQSSNSCGSRGPPTRMSLNEVNHDV